MNKCLLSSCSDEWRTPKYIFDDLDRIYNFDLDPCASDSWHLCERYFTKDDDGLLQDWGSASVFCNPPYGRNIHKWVKKCYDHFCNGHIAVMLIPSRTDTNYFHDYILPFASIHFIRGRISFGSPFGFIDRAPFPSMIVIFAPLDPNLKEDY